VLEGVAAPDNEQLASVGLDEIEGIEALAYDADGNRLESLEQVGLSQRALSLLPVSVRAALPPLYAADNEDDPIVRVKLFAPFSSWTWYVLEGGLSPANGRYTLFALVHGFEDELGYADLEEIAALSGPIGMPMVERDLYWRPRPLSEVQKELDAGRRP
jgi:hypothetical protein